jgi:5-methylcytosine-specific restriction endonuclease McrA
MRDEWVPENVEEFALHLKRNRDQREHLKTASKPPNTKRVALSSAEREVVLCKTDRRCHVCGGLIEGPWQADHVLAHSAGGGHSVDNYLPAHRTCNNYRWDYLPDEFQEILRMGVWLRTQIEKQTPVGRAAGESFIDHEKRRLRRRK